MVEALFSLIRCGIFVAEYLVESLLWKLCCGIFGCGVFVVGPLVWICICEALWWNPCFENVVVEPLLWNLCC